MAPRPSKQDAYSLAPKTLVIDNGAYTLKAGFTNEAPTLEDCQVVPNCLAKGVQNRIWVGAQLHECRDFADMVFRRPVQHGCLVNWEAQKEIWDYTFFMAGSPLYCDPKETNLLLAEAPNGLSNLQRNCDEIVFEELEFAAYRRATGVSLSTYNDIAHTFGDPVRSHGAIDAAECVLVIDSGYSHTIVAPIYKGQPIQQAIKRLDIGGKFITNYLKEILSVRQLNVLNETYIVNSIKEASCFVSTDFKVDMEKAQHPLASDSIVRDYIMPDFTRRFEGELKTHDPADRKQMATFNAVRRENGNAEAVLTLGNERFTPPELLFTPTNIGLNQAGLAESVIQSLKRVPTGLWPAMLANVFLIGGNAKTPGFRDRLYAELRSLAPAECEVRVKMADDPVAAVWLGGVRYATNTSLLKETMITKRDYEELGSAWVERFFSGRGNVS